jgi:ribose transport system substrate-binding protein
VVLFALLGAVLACSPDTPVNPTGTTSTASATGTGTGTVETSISTTVSASASSSESSVATATAVPTGTVVPFRTVPANSAVGRRIGLIGPAGSDPFSRAVTESVVTQLTTTGASLIRCDPGDDASLVLDCARRFATQQVDGWIVVQAGNLGEALCAAGPPGVPLIAVGGAPLACETAWVGADDHRAGSLVGEVLGRHARGANCTDVRLVIVANSAADPVSAARVAGITDGITAACPGLADEAIVLDAAGQDRAYADFTTALSTIAADQRVVVGAVNDASAQGVAAAIPDERAGTVVVAGIGGDERARCEIRTNHGWIGDAALFPDRYGEVVVPALLDALNGDPVPPAMYVETRFLTATSVDRYYDATECQDQ